MYKHAKKFKNILKMLLIIIAFWLISGTLDRTFSSDFDSSDYSDGGTYNLQDEDSEMIETDDITID